jgi:RNA polymerase sigma-70 factor (ECF subfamily)
MAMFDASDEVLLAGLADGDPEASRAFVRRYAPRAIGLANQLVGDRGTAEDVAQEALLRAWRHAATFDPRRGSVSTWLSAIVRNLAIDTLRLRRPEPYQPDALPLARAATAMSAESEAVRSDDADQLRAALREVPVEQRRALVLAYAGDRVGDRHRGADPARHGENPHPHRPTPVASFISRRHRRRGSSVMTTCDDARDAAPELALGTLDGGERAELLRHLSICPACRDETARLVETAEAIGLLAAPVLPSVGFEDRVLAAIGIGPVPAVPRRRRWMKRSAVVLVAAVIGALLAIGGIAVFTNDEPSVATVTSAQMIGTGGIVVGTAYVSPGDPALVVVKVDYPYTGDVFRLEAVRAGGEVDTLGNLGPSPSGGWRWSGLAPGAKVEALRVVDASGYVACEAHLI